MCTVVAKHKARKKIHRKFQSWGQEQMYTINKHSCKTLFQNHGKNDGKRKILTLSAESVQMVQLLEQSHTNHYWRHPCKNQIITEIINIWSNLHSIVPSKDKKTQTMYTKQTYATLRFEILVSSLGICPISQLFLRRLFIQ